MVSVFQRRTGGIDNRTWRSPHFVAARFSARRVFGGMHGPTTGRSPLAAPRLHELGPPRSAHRSVEQGPRARADLLGDSDRAKWRWWASISGYVDEGLAAMRSSSGRCEWGGRRLGGRRSRRPAWSGPQAIRPAGRTHEGRNDPVDQTYQSTPQFLSDARWRSTLPSSHAVLVPKRTASPPASEVAWLDSSS